MKVLRLIKNDLLVLAKELPAYVWTRVTGRRYIDYQTRRYDRIYSRNPDHFSKKARAFQLDYCRAHGLSPDMRFLDYGCGPMAAGIHFLKFLDVNRYVGADISRAGLAAAEQAIDRHGLAAKRPTLVHLPLGDLRPLEPFRFDFIWAQSVVTHMAPEDVERLIRATTALLAPNGQFLATYNSSDSIRQEALKNWTYTTSFFESIAREAKLACEILNDYEHPNEIERNNRRLAVVRLTR